MPIKDNREYRSMMEFRAAADEEYIVEGYASTFDPYLMYSWGGIDYFEEIDRKAFDDADMSDVIMQYDHTGRVFARTSNGTLTLSIDDHGLKIRADLSKSELARGLYNDIKEGLITKMSFAFTVEEDSYNRDTHTRGIKKINKVYDVSAVSFPANGGTDIKARSFFDGVIEEEKAERLEREQREKQKQRIRILAGL